MTRAYKGFNADLTCRGFQYAEGETYEHDGPVQACQSGFHACEQPIHVLRYYSPATSVFHVVEVEDVARKEGGDSKVAARKLTVGAKIGLPGLIQAQVEYVTSRAKPVKGSTCKADNAAATASGGSGAATASGDSGAATASGYQGKAAGADGCALFLAERDPKTLAILSVAAVIVGRDGIEPDVFYTLRGGKVVKA